MPTPPCFPRGWPPTDRGSGISLGVGHHVLARSLHSARYSHFPCRSTCLFVLHYCLRLHLATELGPATETYAWSSQPYSIVPCQHRAPALWCKPARSCLTCTRKSSLRVCKLVHRKRIYLTHKITPRAWKLSKDKVKTEQNKTTTESEVRLLLCSVKTTPYHCAVDPQERRGTWRYR